MPRKRQRTLPRASYESPLTKWSVIPSRAVSDARINTRKPLLLLLAALGIHASVHGLCYPSQRRIAWLCNRSPSWAGKYLRELERLGYIRRLVQPRYRGPRAAWRLQILWRGNDPVPRKEVPWSETPWCWKEPASIREPDETKLKGPPVLSRQGPR